MYLGKWCHNLRLLPHVWNVMDSWCRGQGKPMNHKKPMARVGNPHAFGPPPPAKNTIDLAGGERKDARFGFKARHRPPWLPEHRPIHSSFNFIHSNAHRVSTSIPKHTHNCNSTCVSLSLFVTLFPNHKNLRFFFKTVFQDGFFHRQRGKTLCCCGARASWVGSTLCEFYVGIPGRNPSKTVETKREQRGQVPKMKDLVRIFFVNEGWGELKKIFLRLFWRVGFVFVSILLLARDVGVFLGQMASVLNFGQDLFGFTKGWRMMSLFWVWTITNQIWELKSDRGDPAGDRFLPKQLFL